MWLLHNIQRTRSVEKVLLLFSTPTKFSEVLHWQQVKKETRCTIFLFSPHIDVWRMTEWYPERQIRRPSFWVAASNGTERQRGRGESREKYQTFKSYQEKRQVRKQLSCVSLIGPGKTWHLRVVSGEVSFSSSTRQLWEPLPKQATNGAMLPNANESPNYFRQSIRDWHCGFLRGLTPCAFLPNVGSSLRRNRWTDRFPKGC